MDDNYTKFPNILLDSIDLDVYEFRILSIIVRKTIGYGKKSDGISLSQFMKIGKIGKMKTISTLKQLQNRKLITAKKQMTKTGANSYTRYSLRVVSHTDGIVSETDRGSLPHGQGVVSETDTHKDNNTKENRQKKKKRNIFFLLEEDDRKLYVDKYIKDISKNEAGYKAFLKEKFEEQHKITLEVFEEWYIELLIQEPVEIKIDNAWIKGKVLLDGSDGEFHTKGQNYRVTTSKIAEKLHLGEIRNAN